MIRIQTIVAAATAAVAIGKTVKEMRSTHRYYASQRSAIRLNHELDMQAIKKAEEVISARLMTDYYPSAFQAAADLNPEIERQKTIILQDKCL